MAAGSFLLSGIQQVGYGVTDAPASFAWCRRAFGTDIRIFEDAGEAPLMARYTGDAVHARHAILAANLQGGSALEIWQFTDRTPAAPAVPARLGDLGIFSVRIKARDAVAAHAHLERLGCAMGPVLRNPAGEAQFFLEDPAANRWQVVEAADGWFSRGRHPTGGVAGCMIGVSDIETALRLYSGVLGYGRVLHDESGVFADWSCLPGGSERFRRVLLGTGGEPAGAFGRLLGPSRIELVQALGRTSRRIYAGRFWGDPGFIHVCFDVQGMDGLAEACREAGFPFTVDSASAFSMGEAAGRFAYVEDPDGTLVEFVETRRMAVARSLGLFLDLSRRDPRRPLPRVLLRLLALNRVRG